MNDREYDSETANLIEELRKTIYRREVLLSVLIQRNGGKIIINVGEIKDIREHNMTCLLDRELQRYVLTLDNEASH